MKRTISYDKISKMNREELAQTIHYMELSLKRLKMVHKTRSR